MTEWTADRIRARFGQLNTWRRAGVRAPHKPLMLLFALGRVLRGEARLMRFEDIQRPVDDLITEFGPPQVKTRGRARYPFWHLFGDGLWDQPQRAAIIAGGLNKSSEPRIAVLREAAAGFPEPLQAQLAGQPWLVIELIERLIAGHFPDSYREDIRARIGVPTGLFQAQLLAAQVARAYRYATGRPRDPAFRRALVEAWSGRCAVCGFEAWVRDTPFGVEAAHIKWHAAGGPDTLDNGLLLCVLHHRALDRGLLGLRADRTIKISPLVTTRGVSHQRLSLYDGQLLGQGRAAPGVAPTFVEWHDRQVYRCG